MDVGDRMTVVDSETEINDNFQAHLSTKRSTSRSKLRRNSFGLLRRSNGRLRAVVPLRIAHENDACFEALGTLDKRFHSNSRWSNNCPCPLWHSQQTYFSKGPDWGYRSGEVLIQAPIDSELF